MSSRGGYRGGRGGGSYRGGSKRVLHTGGGGGGFDDAAAARAAQVARRRQEEARFDAKTGFERLSGSAPVTAYLLNMGATVLTDGESRDVAALDMSFLQQDGGTFKAVMPVEPYFYVILCTTVGGGGAAGSGAGVAADAADSASPQGEHEREVHAAMERKFPSLVTSLRWLEMEDLELPNHLVGNRRRLLRIATRSQADAMSVRKALRGEIERNTAMTARGLNLEAEASTSGDAMRLLTDMRDHDVPYVARVAIDLGIRCGKWFVVTPDPPSAGAEGGVRGCCTVTALAEGPNKAEPRILAFDIECTKAPLKFPDAKSDSIYMISYMADGAGFLLTNREIVSADVPDFDYTPLEEYPGPFTVTNLKDERSLLEHFLRHVAELRPNIFVTYNGDSFDWMFIDKRCKSLSLDMSAAIGVAPVFTGAPAGGYPKARKAFGAGGGGGRGGGRGARGGGGGGADADGGADGGSSGGEEEEEAASEYRSRTAVHVDCLYWVKRDSFLPQGSHGLKAVAKEKLNYDPVEVDPEDMMKLAYEDPNKMAAYSVSDAVATYYLYLKYVHSFIFSLASIVPLAPDDVLRKGSGTLCEMLLMAEAHKGGILCPNKQRAALDKTHGGHLLSSETYLGGHVECLETGVFRADIKTSWRLRPDAFDELIRKLDRALTFAIEVEHGLQRTEVVNYDEVRSQIVERLELLRDAPVRQEVPVIYHLDVAAMYPNIILSNRLQPSAMVSPETCAACDYGDDPSARCKRPLEWEWHGEFFPASAEETRFIRQQLEMETFPKPASRWGGGGGGRGGRAGGAGRDAGDEFVAFDELPVDRQEELLRERLKVYCQKAYKRVKDKVSEVKRATVCQRENPFYVNTVRDFRNRRYDYKIATKKAAKKLEAARLGGDRLDIEAAKATWEMNDSLQLAHKVILNSFYGYVMRRGARWHSMEMAGVVTYMGKTIIEGARELVERIGRPLELDTDGIWCILPASFPQRFTLWTASRQKVDVNYPCLMLNADVHDKYTNHQYQELVAGASASYAVRSECSIFFELDGPYQAMVLPSSQEEGRLLKKRYAVFDMDGELAELKGFELKRRGELKMIKEFQKRVFGEFLRGDDLVSCYAAVGEVANYWLNVLDTRGEDLPDEDVIDFLSENRSMSKSLEEYGEQRSVAISTAKRLSEFLGMANAKNGSKGLGCKLLITRFPADAPVSDRAIPTAIFAPSCDPSQKRHFLRKWLRDASRSDFSLRDILDWDYYRTRIAAAIQKIITIPAALQHVPNPVPRVPHPEWLLKLQAERASTHKQTSIGAFFKPAPALGAAGDDTLRGTGGVGASSKRKEQRSRLFFGTSAARGVGDVEDAVPGGSSAGAALLGSPMRKTGGGAGFGSPPRRSAAVGRDGTPLPVMGCGAGLSSPGRASAGGGGSAAGTPGAAQRSRVRARAHIAIGGGDGEGALPRVDEEGRGGATRAPPQAEPALRHGPLEPGTSFEDAAEWYAARREQWRAARAARRSAIDATMQAVGGGRGKPRDGLRKGAPSGSSAAAPTSRANALPGAGHAYLQVVEIREDLDAPGEYVVWAFTAPRKLQALRFTAPRTLYVNCAAPLSPAEEAAAHARPVPSRHLPREAPCAHLYEVMLPEGDFQRAMRGGNGVRRLLGEGAANKALGTYESAAPLFFQVLMHLGCVAQVAANKRPAIVARLLEEAARKRSAAAAAAAIAAAAAPSPAKVRVKKKRRSAKTAAAEAAAAAEGGAAAGAAATAGGVVISPAGSRAGPRQGLLHLVDGAAGASHGAAAAAEAAASVAAADIAGVAAAEAAEGVAAADIAEAAAASTGGADLGAAAAVPHESGQAVTGAAPFSPARSSSQRAVETAAHAAAADAADVAAGALVGAPAGLVAEELDEDAGAKVAPQGDAAAGAMDVDPPEQAAVVEGVGEGVTAAEGGDGAAAAAAAGAETAAVAEGDAPPKAKRGRRKKAPVEEEEGAAVAAVAAPSPASKGGRHGIAAVRRLQTGRGARGTLTAAFGQLGGGAGGALAPSVAGAADNGALLALLQGGPGGSARKALRGDGALSLRPAQLLASSGLVPGDVEQLTTATHPYLHPSSALDISRMGRGGGDAAVVAAAGGVRDAGASALYRSAFLYHSRANAPAAGPWRSFTALFIVTETNAAVAARFAEDLAEQLRSSGRVHPTLPLPEAETAEVRDASSQAIAGVHVPVNIVAHVFPCMPAPTGGATGAKARRAAAAAVQQESVSLPALRRMAEEGTESAGAHTGNAFQWHSHAPSDSLEAVWRSVSALIAEYAPTVPDAGPHARAQPPLIVTLMMPPNIVRPDDVVPALAHVPVVRQPYAAAMSEYATLGWSDAAAAGGVTAFFQSLSWVSDRLQLCRYAQTPLANLDDAAPGTKSAAAAAARSEAALTAHRGDALVPAAVHALNTTAKYQSVELQHGIADLAFARQLAHARHVLWLSQDTSPDLGGAESDMGMVKALSAAASAAAASATALAQVVPGLRLLGPSGSVVGSDTRGGAAIGDSASRKAVALSSALAALLPSGAPRLAQPGVYRCATFAVRIDDLAVNAVLNAGLIDANAVMDESEALAASGGVGGTAAGGSGSGAAPTPSVTSASAVRAAANAWPAFRVLRKLVNAWLADFTVARSEAPYALLRNLYPWLTNTGSLLHDPALLGLVRGLMSRVFGLLLRTLATSGLTIVSASYERVIIASGRQGGAHGATALRHAIERVASTPALANITLEVENVVAGTSSTAAVTYWHSLAFADPGNYAGVSDAPPPEGPAPSLQEASASLAKRIFTATRLSFRNHGEPLSASGWTRLRKAFVRESNKALSVRQVWHLEQSLHPAATEVFRKCAAFLLMKPFMLRAGRLFDRLRARFEATCAPLALGAFESGALLGGGDSGGNGEVGRGGGDTEQAAVAPQGEVSDVEDGPAAPAPRVQRTALPLEDSAGVAAAAGAMGNAEEEEAQLSDLEPAAESLPRPPRPSRTVAADSAEMLEEPAGADAPAPADGQPPADMLAAADAPAPAAAEPPTPAPKATPHAGITPAAALHGSGLPTAAAAPLAQVFNASTVAACFAGTTREEDASDVAAELACVREVIETEVSMSCATAVVTLGTLDVEQAQLVKGGRPALGFVRAVCRLTALEPAAIADAVAGLRTSLYTALNVREGDVAGDPSATSVSFVLADVRCPSCAHCRDVDVLRDERAVFASARERSRGAVPVTWYCPCDEPYSRLAIEAALVSIVERASLAFQAQDTHCERCHRVKASAVRRVCECSGAYVNSVSAPQFHAALATFKTIADTCGFAALEEVVAWLS